MIHSGSRRILVALVIAGAPGIAAAQTPASPVSAPAGEAAPKEDVTTKKVDAADKALEPAFKPAHKEPKKEESRADDKKL
jgi:hypothetical protein